MSQLVHFKEEAQLLFDSIKKLSNEIQLEWIAESDVEKQINRSTPTLMFYGVYNAGKSTLLNAVVGKEVASVADIPETHEVTAYSWKDYDLYDTPGINGPEKDYVISQNELIKHNVILFVIDDSDSFDSKIVSDEIVKIIEADKPLILVMNEKQGSYTGDDTERNEKSSKLFSNISSTALKRGINEVENKIKFISINAHLALSAKLNNKPLLLEVSKLEDLEELILTVLKAQEGFAFLRPPIQMMDQQLALLQTAFLANLESNDEKQLVQLIDELNEQRDALTRRIKSKVNVKLEQTKHQIMQKLIEGKGIEDESENLSTELQLIIEQELKAAISKIDIKLTKFDYDVIQNQTTNSEVAKMNSFSIDEFGKEVVGTYVTNKALSKGVEGIIAKSALSKIIAQPIPVVNAVIILKTLFDLLAMWDRKKKEKEILHAEVAAANAKQEEAFYNKQQALQRLKTQLEIEFSRITEEVTSSLDEQIKEMFTEHLTLLEDQLQTNQQTNTIIQQQINQRNFLKERLNKLELRLQTN